MYRVSSGLPRIPSGLPRLAAAAAVLLLAATPCLALDTIYLARHADKARFWPDDVDVYRPLSEEGMARAEHLAALLADAGIVAIYATPTTRALATGMPLAEKRSVPIEASHVSGESGKEEEFLADVMEDHPGHGAVLIVGHTDTVPRLLVALGAEPACFERIGIVKDPHGLRIDGYDGLWRIDLRTRGKTCARITRTSQKDGAPR